MIGSTMTVAYAGRRPSATGGEFPPTAQGWVTERLQRLFAGLRPRLAVGSGAAGSDLLAARAALRAQVPVRMYIAGTVEDFVRSSVADEGAEWISRFRAVQGALKVSVRVVPSVA